MTVDIEGLVPAFGEACGSIDSLAELDEVHYGLVNAALRYLEAGYPGPAMAVGQMLAPIVLKRGAELLEEQGRHEKATARLATADRIRDQAEQTWRSIIAQSFPWGTDGD